MAEVLAERVPAHAFVVLWLPAGQTRAAAQTASCSTWPCSAMSTSSRTTLSSSSSRACQQLKAAALRSQRRACRQSSRSLGPCRIAAVLDVTSETWDAEVLQSDVPVLVDFWAHWCGPCKLVAPFMTWAEKEYAGGLKVVKVDTAAHPLHEQFKVYGLPALILFKDGAEVPGSKREGAFTKKVLAEYLEKHGVAATAAKQ